MTKFFTFLSISVFVLTCKQKTSNHNEHTYWVNSNKKKCVGVGEMSCLQIQKSDTLDFSKKWELFYDQIEGFTYEPGYLYKIKVRTDTIENPPADASSIRYTLVEVLEKKQDPRLNIHDNWKLYSIKDVKVNKSQVKTIPHLEINVTKMSTYGFDGCNGFSGSIQYLDATKIKFGPYRSTLKTCAQMEIPDKLLRQHSKVRQYKREGLFLIFLNSDNEEILRYKKVD